MSTLLTEYLNALGVPHTACYSDSAFRNMPLKSLFGFARQLKAYGVESVAAQWADKGELTSIPTPFMAQLRGGFVIVKGVDADAGRVDFHCVNHGDTSLPLADFERRWTGLALLAYPADAACEPELGRHRLNIFTARAKRWLLVACVAVLLCAGVIAGAWYERLSTIALLLTDMAGITVTWFLILKTLRVSSRSADRICGIIEAHGCDTVLEQKASTFFGIVSWSEVGLSYFGISTLALLIFPQAIGMLALANLCCLPFSFWSIWYQKYRIHTWCTLCVTTQALLWLQAGCYLWAGAWRSMFPLPVEAAVLLAAYGAALLGLNRVMDFIKRRSPGASDDLSTPS